MSKHSKTADLRPLARSGQHTVFVRNSSPPRRSKPSKRSFATPDLNMTTVGKMRICMHAVYVECRAHRTPPHKVSMPTASLPTKNGAFSAFSLMNLVFGYLGPSLRKCCSITQTQFKPNTGQGMTVVCVCGGGMAKQTNHVHDFAPLKIVVIEVTHNKFAASNFFKKLFFYNFAARHEQHPQQARASEP